MKNYRRPGSMGADLYEMRDQWARWVWKQSPVLTELPSLKELARQLEEEARQRQAEYERRCMPGPLGCYSMEDPDRYKEPADRMQPEEVDRDRSVDEYKVLVETYRSRWGTNITVRGLGDNMGKPFTDLDDYIKYRNVVFTSAEAYWRFARTSDQEFYDNQTKLRRVLDNPYEKKKSIGRESERWDYYYYRWLRKAYLKAGVAENKVIEVVTSGYPPQFAVRLATVKVLYTKPFRHTPEPVPRSKKTTHHLGTVSKHGFGNAVDVESDDNPHIKGKPWRKIEAFTGMTVDRSVSRWKSTPKLLWEDIHEINELYKKKLNEVADAAWKEVLDARAAGKTDTRTEAAVKLAAKKKKAASLGLGDRIHGFFTLEWELVDAFHKNGFLWGATFSKGPDLHHFEI